VLADKRMSAYDACFPLPDGLTTDEQNALSRTSAPGGVYARQRHVGCHSSIPTVLRDMRKTWAGGRRLSADKTRPMFEIYLDDPRKTPAERLKTDLLLPDGVTSRMKSRAA